MLFFTLRPVGVKYTLHWKHSSRSARLILTCYGGIGSWLLFAPSGNKHSNGTVTPVQEEVDCELDSPAREYFLVAVAEKKTKKKRLIRV